jgi:hypothetical protein
MRPVDAGFCKYESLLDGSLTLEDIARMNEYLDVREENEARLRAANKVKS